MAGRFPLFTDENVPGPIIERLKERGWDVLLAIDVFGQRSNDAEIFAYAAEQNRVLVSTDTDCLVIASEWLEEDRPFRLIYWHQGRHQSSSAMRFVEALEALASNEHAFVAGVEYLKIEV